MHKRRITLALISLFGLVLVFTTNPQHLPVVIVIIPYLILSIDLYVVTRFCLQRFYSGGRQSPHRQQTSRALLITAVPILALLLESTGQLSLRDFVILVIIFSLLWFYTARLDWSENSQA